MLNAGPSSRAPLRILLAEDDDRTATFIAEGLGSAGHDVSIVPDGDLATAAIAGGRFDLVILDRMMPGADGMAVLGMIRATWPTLPVLMLTALGGIDERVQGLLAGADDYMVKPFAMAELDARVQAFGRRGARQASLDSPPLTLRFGSIVVDLMARVAHHDGVPIALQARELRLLEALVREEGRTVTRKMLLERVWQYRFDPKTNLIETHVSRLRSKLADAGGHDVIETVWGVGYRLRTP